MTGTDGGSSGTEPGPEAGIDELRADIEHTREQLGESVSALGSKFDVKGRAEDRVAAAKAAVITGAHSVTENARVYPAVPAALATAAVALVVAVVLVRRRRR